MSAKLSFTDAMRERFGLWRCSRGHHALPLIWLRPNQRPVPIDNQPMEMLFATGFAQSFMHWIGWCRRCNRSIEWASYDPRSTADRRAANRERKAASRLSSRGANG